MKAFMDEVRFEEGGSLVHMRKLAFRPDTPMPSGPPLGV